VQPADKQREPADASGSMISQVHAQLGDQLRQYYSEVAEIDPGSRLGRVLGRLSAALDAAEAGRQVPGAFKDDLIDMVPRLRRYAMSLAHDSSEADDLVQLTLLKAWEHRERFQPGTSLVA
jgi:RNA polymerase sigma-70 factor (ECF subfamily)